MKKLIITLVALAMACAAFGQDASGKFGGHEYVDLGLPSGTLWAIANVGATSTGGCGAYYAWGETTPKSSYTAGNYKFYLSGDSVLDMKFSKYGSGKNEAKRLAAQDDAATANFGAGWSMPTTDQAWELDKYCTWSPAYVGDTYGYVGTSKVNGNTIFFPCAGYARDSDVKMAGSQGYYATSELGSFGQAYGAIFMLPEPEWGFVDSTPRTDGTSVRAVTSKEAVAEVEGAT